jgi:hypothetical protein
MAVADNHGPNRSQPLAQGGGVAGNTDALAGVKKHIAGLGFDQTGKSMFAHNTERSPH